MCDVWGENEKETKGNSPEDGQFQFRIPLNGGEGKREKDAKSPVANFTIRNSVTILVKSSDF